MRKFAITLILIGCLGMAIVGLLFAGDYQPMWIRAFRSLPDKQSYTAGDVEAALQYHIEAVRLHYLCGVVFSVFVIFGAAVILYHTRKKDSDEPPAA